MKNQLSLKGKNIRVTGTDETVGIYILASDSSKTKLLKAPLRRPESRL